MDEQPSPLIPHLLRLVEPGASADRFLSMSHTGDFGEDAAFVFPSFRLAQRYAEHFILTGGSTYMPVAAPGRVSTVASAGARCRDCGCISTFACPDACHWIEPDLCSACARPEPLDVWSVYHSPRDYPGQSVARRFCGAVPTTDVIVGGSVDALRELRPRHLTTVPRMDGDDPNIVETWM